MSTSTVHEPSSIDERSWLDKHPTLLGDLGAAAALAIFIAAMCVALAWLAPLELIVPRPR